MNSSIKVAIILVVVVAAGTVIYFARAFNQQPKNYIISVTFNTGGQVTPSGKQIVKENDNVEFTVEPNKDYHIKDVLIDNSSKGQVATYSFQNINGNHTLNVIFEKDKLVNLTKLWELPTEITDAAISGNGNYLAAISKDVLYFYSKNSSKPLWSAFNIEEAQFTAVAISSNGNYTAVVDDTGRIFYYSNTLSRRGDSPATTWYSKPLDSYLSSDTMILSADGQTIMAMGYGTTLHIYDNCTTKKGNEIGSDWALKLNYPNPKSIAVSKDLHYLVIGGPISKLAGFPYLSYIDLSQRKELWSWQSTFNGELYNAVISSDGDQVVAAINKSDGSFSGVYYWNKATQNSGKNPTYSWYGGETGVHDLKVSMSNDADFLAIADTMQGKLLNWQNSTTLKSDNPTTWSVDSKSLDLSYAKDGSAIFTVTSDGKIEAYNLAANLISTLNTQAVYYNLKISNDDSCGLAYGLNGIIVFQILS